LNVKRKFFAVLLGVTLLTAPCFAATPDAVAFLEARVARDPDDFVAWNQLGDRYLGLLRTTGDDLYLGKAAKAAESSLRSIPVPENMGALALRARVALAGHRFAQAKQDAAELVKLQPSKVGPRLILFDALLEYGDYEEAGKLVDLLGREEASAADLESRYARLALVEGRLDDARDHYTNGLAAARALGTPSPDLVSWYCLQLGQLAYRRGDWETAARLYREAATISPSDPAPKDYLAELLAAEGKNAEAIAIYHELIAKGARPHLMQALGDVCKADGKPVEAAEWYDRALAKYMESIQRGEVHYQHHLAGFYTDSRPDAKEAVKWARKDLELRKSIQAWDALAWALYQAGDLAEARSAAEKALATGTADTHILQHAGEIYMAAGDISQGKAFLAKAAEVNPQYKAFHVHR
jgi:tetratricopeptide (TPR) repeat protein